MPRYALTYHPHKEKQRERETKKREGGGQTGQFNVESRTHLIFPRAGSQRY